MKKFIDLSHEELKELYFKYVDYRDNECGGYPDLDIKQYYKLTAPRTMKRWNSEGRLVDKGSKAVGFDDRGRALFIYEQTCIKPRYTDDGRGTDYSEDRYYFGGDNPDEMDYDLGLCGQE